MVRVTIDRRSVEVRAPRSPCVPIPHDWPLPLRGVFVRLDDQR
jgi:hypothetical protein